MNCEEAIKVLLKNRVITPKQAAVFLKRAGYKAGEESKEIVLDWLSDHLSLSDLDGLQERFGLIPGCGG